jgi:hypothetical protein
VKKTRRSHLPGHSTHVRDQKWVRNFKGKPGGRSLLGRPPCRWKDMCISQENLKNVVREVVWIKPSQNRVRLPVLGNVDEICDFEFQFGIFINSGTTVAQWLRYCATNRKVAGSIPDGVIGIFH